MLPWIEDVIADLPSEHAALIRQFAHWQVLRQMRRPAREDRLTQAMANACRRRIRVAVDFLGFLDAHGASAATATPNVLERYQAHVGRTINGEHTFVVWLRTSRINTNLRVAHTPWSPPMVALSDERRWEAVERLLHDVSLRRYTRIGGLFTLLFAQPLSRIVAMRTSQVILAADDTVRVAFNDIAIQMPAVLDDLIREHLQHRGKSLYASRATGWLFPGENPGRHLATENIRAQLVAIGIKPYEERKAALFQLAAEMPAPVLAELIGITDSNAADWARLAAPRLDRVHRRPRTLSGSHRPPASHADPQVRDRGRYSPGEMMVTDLQHFLDLSLAAPGPARRLAEQLGDLVRAATAGDAGSSWESALPCRRRPGNRRCPGRMVLHRDPDTSVPIRWQCSVCEDQGIISNWADSPFDLRPRQLTSAEPVHQIVIPTEVAATLRELQLLDPDCERLVFRIRPHDAGAILPATADDLEELIGFVAAEANHEPNRRRQRRLDIAFDTLNDAAHSTGGW